MNSFYCQVGNYARRNSFIGKQINLLIKFPNNNIQNIRRNYTSRRAVLYVPGNDVKKISKIPDLTADCIVLDCEDGVAATKKVEARNIIFEKLNTSKKIFKGKDCCVRINGIDSKLYEEDLSTVLAGPILPDTIFLPKVENAEHLDIFSNALGKHIKEKLKLVIYVESAQSLLKLPSICEKAVELSKTGPFNIEAIVFGSDDFCADIGATRSKEAKETLFARQWIITTAKAYKLQAIDLVYIDYKDNDGLRDQSIEGAAMGFTGKQVIHPNQIDIVKDAFTPTYEKIKWAKDLIDAFQIHQTAGKGAFTFEDKMIDRPILLQAENILKNH